jgi:hypothetical protein
MTITEGHVFLSDQSWRRASAGQRHEMRAKTFTDNLTPLLWCAVGKSRAADFADECGFAIL